MLYIQKEWRFDRAMLKKTKLLTLAGVSTALVLGTLVAHEDITSHSAKSSLPNANSHTSSNNEIDMKKLSEAFGHFIGKNLKSPGVAFDLDSIIKGMRDGAEGKAGPMSDQEYEALMFKVQEQAFAKLSEDNLKAAEAFMAKNAQETNVQTIVPGKLQYVILQEGTGTVVDEHGTPSINYTAKYIDGTVFDSSEATGGPVTIPLDQTTAGFSKGINGMKEGEKRRLFVHPDLGFGKTGQLPPNSAIIFEVEVVKAKGDTKNLKDIPEAAEEEMLLLEESEATDSKK